VIYCYRCGVELDDDAHECALCGTAVPSTPPDATIATARPGDFPASSFDGQSDVRSALWRPGTLSVGLLTPVPLLVLVWYVQEPGLDWLLWVAGGLVYAWAMAVPIRPLARRPLAYSLAAGLGAIGYLLAIDISDPPVDWALRVAVPIFLTAAAAVLAVSLASKGFRSWDLRALAAIVLGVSVAMTVADGAINLYFGEPAVGSMIATVLIAVPVAATSLYLHYRVGIRIDLRKVFHS